MRATLVRRVWRRACGVLGTAAVGTTVYFLHRNDWDIGSIGVVRFARAASAVGLCAVDYKYTMMTAPDYKEHEQDYKECMHRAHERGAKRLLRLAETNGGVFIKVGQHCGSLEYLLPKEYTDSLSVLHSRAPESAYEDMVKVIEQDLQAPMTSIFSEFDKIPLGAASLAQVYRARLIDGGEEVAVKVQHPKVKPHSVVDLGTMETLAKIVDLLFPEFKLLWLVEETKMNLPKELDFVHEAKCADRVRRMLCDDLPWLKIPKIHWQYVTDRVLVMEYCEGGQVNDKEYLIKHGISGKEVCDKIGMAYSEMIFRHGYVHCDPHPGNLLINRDKVTGGVQIVLLDHGLYTSLNETFRFNYANLWLAIINADIDGIKEYATRMGVGNLYGLFACMLTARSWKSITEGQVDKAAPSKEEVADIQAYVGNLVAQISNVLDKVPRPLILIFKTNDLIRGIEYTLNTTHSAKAFLRMTKRCTETLAAQYYSRCTTLSCRLRISVWLYYSLSKLYIYDWLLAIHAYRMSWSTNVEKPVLFTKL